MRSEEHTSELQSLSAISYAVFCLLKKAGFTFVGPTICYAFMQASGLVASAQLATGGITDPVFFNIQLTGCTFATTGSPATQP